jgi:hypothetical protein
MRSREFWIEFGIVVAGFVPVAIAIVVIFWVWRDGEAVQVQSPAVLSHQRPF